MEQNELLDFARNFFEEMRIHTRLIDAPYPWDDAFDLNLRHTLLKYDEDVASTFFSLKNTFMKSILFILSRTYSGVIICAYQFQMPDRSGCFSLALSPQKMPPSALCGP